MRLKYISKISVILLLSIFFIIPQSALSKTYDFNKDGKLSSHDIDILSTFLGSNDSLYDLNDDGIVDAVDVAILAKHIDSNDLGDQIFTVYKNNSPLKEFTQNNLLDAISLASQSNGIVKTDDVLIWNDEEYFIYSNNYISNRSKSIHDAVKIAYNLENSIVTSKNGNVIYNKPLNYRKIMGVTRTNVNLRSEPNMSARTDLMIPDGTLVECLGVIRGFYEICYYDNNNTIHTGFVPSYLDIIQDDINNSQLGYISAREESNGNPGAVGLNPNDKGGASFGVWQLSSKMGAVDEFLKFIKDKNPEIYNSLYEAKKRDNNTFSDNFINKWKEIANTHYDVFYQLQRLFIKRDYFDSFETLAKKNNLNITSLLEFNSTSNMIWSSSVQHGPSGLIKIFKKIPLSLSIEEIVRKVYEERLNVIAKSYPPDSSNPGVVALYNGIKTRLENECAEILRIYKRELSY